MAKKSAPAATPSVPSLSFRDLVLGADAETIRQALEARLRIDELIAERQAAYERISALETQIEDVIGEPGVFPFPAPPLPVAGIDPRADTLARVGGATSASAATPTANASASAKKSPGRPRAEPVPAELPDSDDEDTDNDTDDAPSTAKRSRSATAADHDHDDPDGERDEDPDSDLDVSDDDERDGPAN